MDIKRVTSDNFLLAVDLFNQYRIFYGKASDPELALLFIKERILKNESVIFVAMDKETPVGFTQLYPSFSSVNATKRWILNDLFVDMRYRNAGTGRKLIETVLDFADKDFAEYVQLETVKDNHAAKKLYEKIGFALQNAANEYDVYRILCGN